MISCTHHPDRPAVPTDVPLLAPLCRECTNARLAELGGGQLGDGQLGDGQLTDAAEPSTPPVVCLCGSTGEATMPHLVLLAQQLTLAGCIVVRPEVDMRRPDPAWGREVTAADKIALDGLHRAKIRLADQVVIVAKPTGELGESTRAELDYATELGKRVRIVMPGAPAAAVQITLHTTKATQNPAQPHKGRPALLPHSPADRPVGRCGACGKQGYRTRRAARTAARKLHPGASGLSAYRCHKGGELYHFGHRCPPGNRPARRRRTTTPSAATRRTSTRRTR